MTFTVIWKRLSLSEANRVIAAKPNGGGVTLCNELYGKAPPERGPFFGSRYGKEAKRSLIQAGGMWKGFLFWLKVWERGPLFRLEVCERGTFFGSRYGKEVPYSGWRYVKGVPFQGKVCERWKGPDFPKFSIWKGKGSEPRAEHPLIKSVGVQPPGDYYT